MTDIMKLIEDVKTATRQEISDVKAYDAAVSACNSAEHAVHESSLKRRAAEKALLEEIRNREEVAS